MITNKTFLVLLAVVLLGGGSIGGAFAAGMALGQSNAEKVSSNGQDPPTGLIPPGRDAGVVPLSFEQLRELSPEQIQNLRQELMEQFAQNGGFGNARMRAGRGQDLEAAGRARLTGKLENIEENVITVNTRQGLLDVTVNDQTTIVISDLGNVSDLNVRVGETVIITGQRVEDGSVIAQSVTVAPVGIESVTDRNRGRN